MRRMTSQPVQIEEREDGGKRLTGYAAVFYRAGDPGTEFQLWDNFRERVAPGAFDRAMKEKHDVRAAFNHDSDHVLGRTTSGTLRLSTDKIGLKYQVDLPDTQIGRDVAELVSRGDVTGSSFAFEILSEKRTKDGDTEIRSIEDVRLFDVGPVTYPAYEATTVALRSDESLETIRREMEQEQHRPHRIKERLRAMEIIQKSL
jgi:HK97 family phage prohead protease